LEAPMKIGFVGCGRLAMELARLLVPTRHEIAVCGTQEPVKVMAAIDVLEIEPLDERADEPRVIAMHAWELVPWATVLVCAVPWEARGDALEGMDCEGKIVVDPMNAPELVQGSSEIFAHEHPGIRLVKTFNTLEYLQLQAIGHGAMMPAASDDADALDIIARIIIDMGLRPLLLPRLRYGRLQEPGGLLYGKDAAVRGSELLGPA
jgi:predicted dinucleotide-binding enzyme